MRLELGQYGYQYTIEIRVKKKLNMTETFSPLPVSYSRNPSGIDTGYDAGLYGLNRVDTVWIRLEIRLYVSVNAGMQTL